MKWTIHYQLSARKGTNIKVQFEGTRAAAKQYAVGYAIRHHIFPEATYLWEATK